MNSYAMILSCSNEEIEEVGIMLSSMKPKKLRILSHWLTRQLWLSPPDIVSFCQEHPCRTTYKSYGVCSISYSPACLVSSTISKICSAKLLSKVATLMLMIFRKKLLVSVSMNSEISYKVIFWGEPKSSYRLNVNFPIVTNILYSVTWLWLNSKCTKNTC